MKNILLIYCVLITLFCNAQSNNCKNTKVDSIFIKHKTAGERDAETHNTASKELKILSKNDSTKIDAVGVIKGDSTIILQFQYIDQNNDCHYTLLISRNHSILRTYNINSNGKVESAENTAFKPDKFEAMKIQPNVDELLKYLQ